MKLSRLLLTFSILFYIPTQAFSQQSSNTSEDLATASGACASYIVNMMCKGMAERLARIDENSIEFVSVDERSELYEQTQTFAKFADESEARTGLGKHRNWLLVDSAVYHETQGSLLISDLIFLDKSMQEAFDRYNSTCLNDNSAGNSILDSAKNACSGSYYAWRTFTGERFGLTIEYPMFLLKEQRAPENNDGRTFLSYDGTASLSAFGRFNTDDWRDASEAKAAILNAGDYTRLTYERLKGDWFVLSGYRGNKVYYEKYILSCNNQVVNAIVFEHDKDDIKRFAQITSRIANSLRAGIGYDVSEEEC